VSLRPSPLLTAARQQRTPWSKDDLNNDWQALAVGLLDTRQIARIVASNTTRIDLPIHVAAIEALVQLNRHNYDKLCNQIMHTVTA